MRPLGRRHHNSALRRKSVQPKDRWLSLLFWIFVAAGTVGLWVVVSSDNKDSRRQGKSQQDAGSTSERNSIETGATSLANTGSAQYAAARETLIRTYAAVVVVAQPEANRQLLRLVVQTDQAIALSLARSPPFFELDETNLRQLEDLKGKFNITDSEIAEAAIVYSASPAWKERRDQIEEISREILRSVASTRMRDVPTYDQNSVPQFRPGKGVWSNGGSRPAARPQSHQCEACNGSGLSLVSCASCGGAGKRGNSVCSFCRGRGVAQCLVCNGSGQLR